MLFQSVTLDYHDNTTQLISLQRYYIIYNQQNKINNY